MWKKIKTRFDGCISYTIQAPSSSSLCLLVPWSHWLWWCCYMFAIIWYFGQRQTGLFLGHIDSFNSPFCSDGFLLIWNGGGVTINKWDARVRTIFVCALQYWRLCYFWFTPSIPAANLQTDGAVLLNGVCNLSHKVSSAMKKICLVLTYTCAHMYISCILKLWRLRVKSAGFFLFSAQSSTQLLL